MNTREEKIMSLVQTVRDVHGMMQHIITKSLVDLDLTPQQFSVLDSIGNRGARSNGDLCREMSLSKGTVSGILKRLEERDLVVRSIEASDRRNATYTFTPAGKALYKRFEEARSNICAALLDGSTHADLAAWSRQLERLAATLKRKGDAQDA